MPYKPPIRPFYPEDRAKCLALFDANTPAAFLPEERRCASMCVYKVEAGAVTAERYQYDGAGFREEAGGAFASGR